MSISPTVGIIVLFIGFIISAIIRAPYDSKSKSIPILQSQKDSLEIFLLVLMMIGVLILPLIFALSPLLSFADHQFAVTTFAVGVLLMLLSLWLFYRSHSDLGSNWSVSLEIRDTHSLVTTGVYKYIRHPMYTSLYLYAFAQFFLLPNWIAGSADIVSFTVLYLFRIGREERLMEEAFGDGYREYILKTKRLIPYLY